MAERYCVPTSLPWRMPWVGSWISKNLFTRSAYDTTVGSKTMRTASVCPVRPEQTSSYDGCAVWPPA
jgi:hypothetical protein